MMKPIRFAIVGGGWRAAFFARIAQAMPERFTLTGSCLRDPEKARLWAERWGGRACTKIEELLRDEPEYIVLSIAREAAPDQLIALMRLGVPILCETPPAYTMEALTRVWAAARETGTPVYVAEQYPDWPLYSAWQRAVDEGLIGEVSNLSISALHSYHAVAIMRRFLGAGMAGAEISGQRFTFPVRVTDSRAGLIAGGEIQPAARDRLTFVFANGKTAFFDFSSVQYHSFIRTRHFSVQGTDGEIDDLTVRYMNGEGLPVEQTLRRMDRGAFHNAPAAHMGLVLGDKWLYRNPYADTPGLNDDEIAVAACMERAGRAVRGESSGAYTLREGLQDAYFGLLMEEALQNPGRIVRAENIFER